MFSIMFSVFEARVSGNMRPALRVNIHNRTVTCFWVLPEEVSLEVRHGDGVDGLAPAAEQLLLKQHDAPGKQLEFGFNALAQL